VALIKHDGVLEGGIHYEELESRHELQSLLNLFALAWSSAGSLGFKGSKKSTPFAAQMAAEAATKVAMETRRRFGGRHPL
jgi:hypothetical protein